MSTKKERCLNDILMINCCIVNKDIYVAVGEKDHGEKYDPWEEWPPTHLVFYYKKRIRRGDEPWGCIRFGKNNFKWSKIVHINNSNVLLVDNERGVETRDISNKISNREQQIPITTIGNVQNLKNIHGTVYAVGGIRGVARREGKDKWVCISNEIKKLGLKLPPLQVVFNAIDGFEAYKDLYAGGGHSDMWHYDGEHWRAIDLPILTMRISAIVCADDKQVYAVGRFGHIVQGRGDKWKMIEQDLTTQDFTDAVWYNDRLYLCSISTLYELKDGKLSETHFGNVAPRRAGSLYVNEGLMMTAGNNSMAVYDGKVWDVLYGGVTFEDEKDMIITQQIVKNSEEMVDALNDLVDAVKAEVVTNLSTVY